MCYKDLNFHIIFLKQEYQIVPILLRRNISLFMYKSIAVLISTLRFLLYISNYELK